jgi:CO/xanthine dehydrogenase Mo-binding subunit
MEERGMAIGEIFLAKFGSLGTTLAAEAVCQPTAAHMDPETGQSEKCTEYWFPSATAAEVEVDTETGQVKVLQLSASAIPARRSIRATASSSCSAPR